MANLEDLGTKSISEMTTDEAIEYLRQIRLSRRTPAKQAKKRATKKARSKKPNKLTATQAANLLKQLEGK